MATSYRRFTKVSFIVLNVLAAIAFLLGCLAPYLNPKDWWLISLTGLGFAFSIITLIAFLFFWLVFKLKYTLISLIPLLIGWKSISVFFAFHLPDKFRHERPDNVLRVAQWNVARFSELKKNNNKGSQTRLSMFDLIREQDAGVICMQEFFTSMHPDYYDNLNHMMKELGYPYYYYSWDNDGHLKWIGQAIFSHYPIISKGMIRFPRPGMPESLIYTDLLFNRDTVRVYTTHLQSVQFKKQDYESIENIKNTGDDMVENSRNIFSKLKRGQVLRSGQAEIVRSLTSQSPYPFILTGDFNDVPNSYTYFTIKGSNLQDAFLAKGLGVGRTYSNIAPTLRIDYILATKDFSVKQFNRIVRDYSDHYMLVADLELKGR
ncbi:MAG TPA: endonuclease/exonuclease/phosphatase family protein [Flavisolibacter sp.]|nr:endonuclease/exonuclease/phosphatase family protein [Flavisolibacter sp.]